MNLAAQVRVPVFLAAGGQDQRAPIVHSERMEAALKKAGSPVETLYVRNEGHGFYSPANQRTYYSRLLAFLSRSLGDRWPRRPRLRKEQRALSAGSGG